MKKYYPIILRTTILPLCIIFLSTLSVTLNAQSFSQNSLDFNGNGSINSGTSLMFGPDGRLYVSEVTGAIKIFDITRDGPGDYKVLSMEELSDIQTIIDHDDFGNVFEDGDNNTDIFRLVTGITVAGTISNPIIYVTSSTIMAGGPPPNSDVDLDTNSGVITRITWTGTTWDTVDLVRGLPRSEENHATNGLELVNIGGVDHLLVASGGNTNGGSASTNFAWLTEYALSSAILAINLDQLNALPILNDNGRKYIYDLPTVDDPTRNNVNGITDPDDPGYDGIDINDPFGGNDGLNQALLVPGGPVQIFSSGWRNSYDLVVTESGAVYATDNGANTGWGGFPHNEGGGGATNEYFNTEPGSSSSSGGEIITNDDHLQRITSDLQSYTFGQYYAGHPNPIRANPSGAGLFTNPSVGNIVGSVFRTQLYDPDGSTPGSTTDPGEGLPANWPPVPLLNANPIEGDYRGPGIANPDGPDDDTLVIWGTNTNGIDEYTASNFGGAMQGDLISGTNLGVLRRVELNPDGSLENFTPQFASGLGGNALGITCNGDADPFPGSIWVATFNTNIIILEPQDFIDCLEPGDPGYDPMADNDFDGYTNQDEIDNGTDPCNGASQPSDFDKGVGGTLISDLNDTDDDNDGIIDGLDPFQLGNPPIGGSDAFELPVVNELFSDNPELGGYLGLGMTGLMNNGDTGNNWLDWIDDRDNGPNPNDVLGGATGSMTMHMTDGTALGTVNTQEKGFQYGVQVDQSTSIFTISSGIINFNAPLQLYGNTAAPNGELGVFLGDGTQSNYIKFVITPSGLMGQQEINDVPQTPITLNIASGDRPNGLVVLYMRVDPVTGEVELDYKFDSGPRLNFTTITAQGNVLSTIQDVGSDLAVGFIGTSNETGVEVEGTWGFLNVIGSAPVVTTQIPDRTIFVGQAADDIVLDDFFDDNGGVENLTYTVTTSNPAIGASISGNTLTLTYPTTPFTSTITVTATDLTMESTTVTFTVTVTDEPVVLYRVNAGGLGIPAIDGGLAWEEDTILGNSDFLVEPGTNQVGSFNVANFDPAIDLTTTPTNLFQNERFDGTVGAPNMTYSFPATQNGNYEVRLYMANGFEGTSAPGQRIFDVSIEGIIYPALDDIDLSATYGHLTGTVITHIIEVVDGVIDIEFIHGVENPLIDGIEILKVEDTELPIYVDDIVDQQNFELEQLDGSLVVAAAGGQGALQYSASNLPPGIGIDNLTGEISGVVSTGAAVNSPYLVTITVDDSDGQNTDAVSTTFNWVIDVVSTFRINAGGTVVSSTDESPNWEDNSGEGLFTGANHSVNTGLIFAANLDYDNRDTSIPAYIDEATFEAIFAQERFDLDTAPEMEFEVPLTNQDYVVNLFLGNSFAGTSNVGDRVFDIEIEGVIAQSGLDLIDEFGHLSGGMLSFPVTVTDGELNIRLLHDCLLYTSDAADE